MRDALQKMKDAGVELSDDTYNTLIDGFKRGGTMEEVMEMLEVFL